MNEIQERMKELLSSGGYLLDREDVCRMTLLALAAEESVFLYGPPGTAKSMAAKWAASLLDTDKYFSCLLNQYTQPDELFGPVSIKSLESGLRETLTEGYLPDSEIAFLDEIWKAGPAILNTLLTICNEKTFRNGSRTRDVPLKLLMSASNEFPSEDSGLEPLYDRFLIRMCVGPIGRKDKFVSMITGGKNPEPAAGFVPVSEEELAGWRRGSAEVEVPKEITDFLYSMRLRLNERDVYVSDRRWKKVVNLLRTSAHLNGRRKVGYSDLFVLQNTLWTRVEDKEAVLESALESVSSATVEGSFSFVERISNEIKSMAEAGGDDGALLSRIESEREYLNTLKRELEIARSGGENFWKNVFSGLSTEFELEMMNKGIEKLREFITESEVALDGLKAARRSGSADAGREPAATVILERDGGLPYAQNQSEGRFEQEEEATEKRVMSIREMQAESFRRIEDSLSIGGSGAQDAGGGSGEPARESAESEGDEVSESSVSSVSPVDSEPSGAAGIHEAVENTENSESSESAEISESSEIAEIAESSGISEADGGAEADSAEAVDCGAGQAVDAGGAVEEPREPAVSAADVQARRLEEEDRKSAERERIKEQIQQAIRRNQVEEQSRNIIQNGISRIIKAFSPEKVQAVKTEMDELQAIEEMEQMKERTAQVRQELQEMSAAHADAIESAADEGERTEYENRLSNTRSFQEFVEMSHYKYTGDSSDKRYKWNGNLNNGAKWWNVGSRFYQMLDGDRNTLSAIEAECAKRGAKIGGKYHWVFSVCYIFEKNDGRYDWKTRAELKWLLGAAWHYLEPVFNEALL